MKSRQEVRNETQKGARIFGYIALGIAVPGVLMLTVIAPMKDIDYPFLAGLLIVFLLFVGIMGAFPKWEPSHVILAHFDALLDRIIGKDKGAADG